jgi:4-hydroxy-3-methylbut-2-enyl diphosphate reductase
MTTTKKIYLANTMGFCAGVSRAIEIINILLAKYDKTVYVKHEIVHNKFVIDDFKKRGVRFIEEIAEVPDNAILVYSAHGVSLAIKGEVSKRDIHKIFDATCPLVSKIHSEVMTSSLKGRDCIMVGHNNHPEVVGTLGHFDSKNGGEIYLVENTEDANNVKINKPESVICVTQTTLSIDETKEINKILKSRFPKIIYPKNNDICYATQNRQDSLKILAKNSDIILVIGSHTSSNSSRLVEIAKNNKCDSYLIDDISQIKLSWFADKTNIGITAGASTPQELVKNITTFLQKNMKCEISTLDDGIVENMYFSLPSELKLLDIDDEL